MEEKLSKPEKIEYVIVITHRGKYDKGCKTQ